jgi:hypothetical protein
MMDKLIAYVKQRLKEPSTWNAIVGVAIAVGIITTPEQEKAILGLGASIYTFINVFWKKDSQSKGTGDGTETANG